MNHLLLLLLAAASTATALIAQGGPPGAAVRDLIVARANPNLVFVATDRGVFQSTTAGETWARMNSGLPLLDIPSIAGTSESLYAAVREDGVYRLAEDGSWEPAANGLDGQDVLSVAIDPNDANTVYAGSNGGLIFKSLNGGDDWASASQGLAEGRYLEIAVSPHDPDLVFAANLSGQSATGRLLRSADGGGQWEVVASGQSSAFLRIGFSASTPGTAWIATTTGLLVTFDSGDNFAGPLLRTNAFLDVTTDPTDSQIIYAASRTVGVLTSRDGGASWFAANGGLPRSMIVRVHAGEKTLLAGLNGSGVFRSHDGGVIWRLSSAGLNAAFVPALAINPANSEAVLASTSGGGMFRSTSGGSTWGESRQGLTVFQVNAMRHTPPDPDRVYAGSINPFNATDGAFLRSTDGGVTWESIFPQLPVFALAVHPVDSNTVYVGSTADQFFGTPGLSRSVDGGEQFSLIFGENDRLVFLDVTEVEVDPQNPRNLYLISRDPTFSPPVYEFLRSNDEGVNWLGSGLTTNPLTEITLDPANPQRILVGSLNGIFSSTNGGANFSPSNTGLPDAGAVAVSSIVFDSNDSGATYATTSAGVYRSADSGANWATANTGLENTTALRLREDPNNAGVLYAATIGAGVYKTVDAGANWLPTGGIPGLSARGIVNAAAFYNGAVSPGEIVAIFVTDAGPAEGVQAGFDPDTGGLPTTLAGVRVFFNETPAPLFFVRSDQLNVQVPFEVAGLETVEVRVEYQGATSSFVQVSVSPTHPGIFSSVLNGDQSPNSEQNPESAGGTVVLYVTGQGTVSPTFASGQPGSVLPPFPTPQAPVRVLVNGEPATIEFDGLAPFLVGLLQLNVMLPGNVSGQVEIQVFIGDAESPSRATVFVQ